MRKLLNILVFVSVVLYSLSAPLMWGIYYVRSDAIAAAYCVNPDKPSCHGKCHMAKLMDGDRSHNKSDIPPLLQKTDERILLLFHETVLSDGPSERLSLGYGKCRPFVVRAGYPQGVYHPPTLLV